MTRHRAHSIEFKRQVAQEFLAGETLHGLAKHHDISRNLTECGSTNMKRAPLTRMPRPPVSSKPTKPGSPAQRCPARARM